jgi:hypothetical protein
MRKCMALMIVALVLGAACRGEPAGERIDIDHLTFVLPPGWHRVIPGSSMRVAQASIAGAAGDAELAMYYFGPGQGGAIESNVQRWMNQVVPTTGIAPQRGTFDSNGLRITWVDARGTLKPGEMGMGAPNEVPDARLLGAVIEGDHGPWFIKATGPNATLEPQREAFMSLLHSAAPR